MTKLGLTAWCVAAAAFASAVSHDHASLLLIGAAAALCGGVTWRSATLSPLLRIFVALFTIETIVFGLAAIADHLGGWPKALDTVKIPDELVVTAAIFAVLAFGVGRIPKLRAIFAIADRYFAAANPITVRRTLFPPFVLRERTIAASLVVSLVLINQVQVYLSVRHTYWYRDIMDALSAKDAAEIWKQLFVVFTILAVAEVAAYIANYVVNAWLDIRWRRWLTDHFVERWLSDQAHYRMTVGAAAFTDNPDQRIAADVASFTSTGVVYYAIVLVSKVSSLVSFGVILWTLSAQLVVPGTQTHIPGLLFWVAFAYATLLTGVAHAVGRSLSRLFFEKERVNADFRFSLARLREFSEQVALLKGESSERRSLGAFFNAIATNYFQIVDRKTRLLFCTKGLEQMSTAIPYAMAVPFYLGGQITLGVVTMTGSAFFKVESALSFIWSNYAALADFSAVATRLVTFDDAIVRARDARNNGSHEVLRRDDGITVTDLFVHLPDGRPLLREVSTVFSPGESVLLSGHSGAGKSTLFRVLAGAWPHWTGSVSFPAGAKLMVVPQKCYIPNGRLREAVTYPDAPDDHSGTEISAALHEVGLDALADQLDKTDTWSQRLSGGEQQRLALARALLARPDWLFLDEATAAMDEALEADVYRMLAAQLPKATIVSVGHRSTLAAFHDRRLVLTTDVKESIDSGEHRVAAE